MVRFALRDFPDPISTVRICTEEIQCEMRHRCSRSEKVPPPPPNLGRLVGSLVVGMTTVTRHCIYVPNIKVVLKEA